MKKPLVIDGGVRWAPVDEAYRDFPAATFEDRRAICRQCGQRSHTVDGRSVHAWRRPAQYESARADVVKGLVLVAFLLVLAFGSAYVVASNSPWPL